MGSTMNNDGTWTDHDNDDRRVCGGCGEVVGYSHQTKEWYCPRCEGYNFATLVGNSYDGKIESKASWE